MRHVTADVSEIYALRLNLGKPATHVIMPDVIARSRSRLVFGCVTMTDVDREMDAVCDDPMPRSSA